MKHILLITSLGLAAAPVAAQDGADSGTVEDEGALGLMEEGAKLFFRGMIEGMEPALDELEKLGDELRPALRDFTQEMGPALRDLLREVEDWSVYHPPEMLPNGDIILRRKTPEELAPQPGDEVEI